MFKLICPSISQQMICLTFSNQIQLPLFFLCLSVYSSKYHTNNFPFRICCAVFSLILYKSQRLNWLLLTPLNVIHIPLLTNRQRAEEREKEGERESDMIHLQLCLFRVSSNLNAAYFHKAYFPNRRRESKQDKEREREANIPEDRERAFSQLVD